MDEIEKNNGEIIIYRTEDGRTQLEVRLENENVWPVSYTHLRAHET